MDNSGRVLGVDYGSRRVGVAMSDSMRMVATPLETISVASDKQALRRLRELVAAHDIQAVVIGLPLHMDGGRGELAEAADGFAERLGKQVPKLAVHLWDERLSTAEAERAMRSDTAKAGRRKDVRDQLAAQLILQSWLDAQAGPLPLDAWGEGIDDDLF